MSQVLSMNLMSITVNASESFCDVLMVITVNASGVISIWCQLLRMHEFDVNYCKCIRIFYKSDVNYSTCIRIFLWNWCQLLQMHQDLSMKLVSITVNAPGSCMHVMSITANASRSSMNFDVDFCECGRILYEIWFYVIVLKNFCVPNIPRIVISWIM